MKYIKRIGLPAVAMLMAFAGVASASQVTSPAGTLYTSTIKASDENGHVSIHGSNSVTIECFSALEGKVESHGAAVTSEGKLSKLVLVNCTNGNVVHTKKTGSVIIHSLGGGNGTVTSTGAEIEATAETVFGTITCIYTTNATDIGTLTGGSPATIDINGATLPRTGGSGLCGSTGLWTGNYRFSTPATMIID